jgi:hypothetical protein
MSKFGGDDVGAIMAKYDTDGNGSFSISEVRLIVEDVQKQKSENRSMKKLICMLLGFMLLLLVALVGTSLFGAVIGGDAIKETRVAADQPPPGARAVATAPLRSHSANLFGLANAPTDQLALLQDVTMYVDMTSGPPAGVVESSFKIAGAYKASVTQAYLVTNNGYNIVLDSAAQTGSITMDGSTYTILEEMPSSANGRSLELAKAQTPPIPTLIRKDLVKEHQEKRRKLSFEGGLMTSGSFTMMAAGSVFGRNLQWASSEVSAEGSPMIASRP